MASIASLWVLHLKSGSNSHLFSGRLNIMMSVISPVLGVRAMPQWSWGHHLIRLLSLVGWHNPWGLSQEWVSGSGWAQEPRQTAWHARMLNYFSHVWFFVTLWTVAHQAPLSMGFFRQEYWSGLPCPPPGDLHDPGIEPKSLSSLALEGGLFISSTTCCCCSIAKSCPTLCRMPGFSVLHYVLEFAKTHVCWVSDAIQPSLPLFSPSPPAFNLSQHQGLFQWVSSWHQAANVLELQLQHQFFQWLFRVDFL